MQAQTLSRNDHTHTHTHTHLHVTLFRRCRPNSLVYGTDLYYVCGSNPRRAQGVLKHFLLILIIT